MKEIWIKLNILLDKKQKKSMGILILLMVFGAFLEASVVTAIVYVAQLIMTENILEQEGILKSLYEWLPITSEQEFIVWVMGILIGLIIFKTVYLYIEQKLQLAFVYGNQFRTSERMMRNYLRKSYEFYLYADTAVVQRNITSDVNNMYGLILALLIMVSESIVFIFLLTVLLLQDVVMTCFIGGILVILLGIIKVVLKPIMKKAGEENQEFYSGLFKWISQTVTGIKEVKVGGKESYFVEEYLACGKGYVNAVQKYSLYNNIPRLIIEAVAYVALLGYLLVLILQGGNPEDMVTTLTAFVAAAGRLLPCANRMNNQMNNIEYFKPFLMGVSNHLQDEIGEENVDFTKEKQSYEKMEIKKVIELKDITYAYPNTDKLIFDHANMTIPVGSAIGVVGTTGAGKTTIIDILLGLLDVSAGEILADNKKVKDNYRSWLKNIGYIPQMIFMLDSTIRKNVAFGIAEEDIDEERVWAVLKEARLDEFVQGLPQGLDTGIGERGIRLSGGQRQRIGIARALYEDPEILILDEATSALDNDTEAAIMESINYLQGEKTLVIIAHRLQTIEKCDIIYEVNQGKIIKK